MHTLQAGAAPAGEGGVGFPHRENPTQLLPSFISLCTAPIHQEKKTALSRLSNLQDSVKDLSKSGGGSGTVGGGTIRPGSACSGANLLSGPASREVRQLENRLDKAMLKTNEAQSIQHTYEQVWSMDWWDRIVDACSQRHSHIIHRQLAYTPHPFKHLANQLSSCGSLTGLLFVSASHSAGLRTRVAPSECPLTLAYVSLSPGLPHLRCWNVCGRTRPRPSCTAACWRSP